MVGPEVLTWTMEAQAHQIPGRSSSRSWASPPPDADDSPLSSSLPTIRGGTRPPNRRRAGVRDAPKSPGRGSSSPSRPGSQSPATAALSAAAMRVQRAVVVTRCRVHRDRDQRALERRRSLSHRRLGHLSRFGGYIRRLWWWIRALWLIRGTGGRRIRTVPAQGRNARICLCGIYLGFVRSGHGLSWPGRGPHVIRD